MNNHLSMASRKRSLSDMKSGRSQWASKIDDEEYNLNVLHLAAEDTEVDLDKRLALEAHEVGVDPLSVLSSISVDGLTASLSATTIASDPSYHPSRLTQLTGSTSCATSERYQSPGYMSKPCRSPTHSLTPSILSSEEKHSSRHSLRESIRRITGFKRHKSSIGGSSSALQSIDANIVSSSSRSSLKAGQKSPVSIKSYCSTSSTPASPIHEGKPLVVDDDCSIRRTTDSPQLQVLRQHQLQERDRFLTYQRECLDKLRDQHKSSNWRTHDAHAQAAAAMEEKNLLAADDLEARQLEAEANFREELEAEKRACLIRLKHMEAYCHTPSPPTTPRSAATESDEHLDRFPERRVTEKDYHNLASQYRERDAMDNLHKAKIEVMQGRQEKVYNDFVKRKERELAVLVANQKKAEAKYATKCRQEEEVMMQRFDEKRLQLQGRWKLQGLVQCLRLEQEEGVHYAVLPDITFELDRTSE